MNTIWNIEHRERRLVKQAWGCLMGAAVGDAMGMPSSFLTRERIKKEFGIIETFFPAPPGHAQHSGLAAGQITDDTQQTLCLARTIIEEGAVVPEGFADRLVEWAKAEGVFGLERGIVGPTTRVALKELESLEPGEKRHALAGIGRYGKTNGAVMRIAPVGILHAHELNNLSDIIDDVEKACLPTHWTNIAIAGAGAVAAVIAAFLNGYDIAGAIALARKAVDLGMQRGNPVSGSSITKRLDMALKIVEENKNRELVLDKLYDLVGNDIPVYETVPFCIAVLYLSKADPMEGIKLAVNLGGDADTTGSIIGAMAGACRGIDAFPQEVIDTVETVNRLDLKETALKLLKVSKKT